MQATTSRADEPPVRPHHDTAAIARALHDLTGFYMFIVLYALLALAAFVIGHWYVRTSPSTATGSTYTDADHDAIARMHLRYRARH